MSTSHLDQDTARYVGAFLTSEERAQGSDSDSERRNDERMPLPVRPPPVKAFSSHRRSSSSFSYTGFPISSPMSEYPAPQGSSTGGSGSGSGSSDESYSEIATANLRPQRTTSPGFSALARSSGSGSPPSPSPLTSSPSPLEGSPIIPSPSPRPKGPRTSAYASFPLAGSSSPTPSPSRIPFPSMDATNGRVGSRSAFARPASVAPLQPRRGSMILYHIPGSSPPLSEFNSMNSMGMTPPPPHTPFSPSSGSGSRSSFAHPGREDSIISYANDPLTYSYSMRDSKYPELPWSGFGSGFGIGIGSGTGTGSGMGNGNGSTMRTEGGIIAYAYEPSLVGEGEDEGKDDDYDIGDDEYKEKIQNDSVTSRKKRRFAISASGCSSRFSFNPRGIANLATLITLVAGIIALFVALPAVYYQHRQKENARIVGNPYINSTGQASTNAGEVAGRGIGVALELESRDFLPRSLGDLDEQVTLE